MTDTALAAAGNPALVQDTTAATPVHHFKPDASPSEKAQQALQSTPGMSTAEAKKTEADIQKAASVVQQAGTVDTASASLTAEPAEPPVTSAAEMDPLLMAIAGYEQARGNKQEQLERMRKGPLGAIPEAIYGAVWHDGVCILVVGFLTWLMSWIGGGFILCLPIWIGGAIYYATSLKHYRILMRDEIERSVENQRLDEDVETVAWINTMMDRFWLTLEPVISAIVIEQVDPYLQMYRPSFLDDLKLTTFTLGNKAPRVESVRCFQRTDDDVILMDWRVGFLPNDLSDLTGQQAAAKVNPKVVLNIRLGKGMVGAAMPIMVEDMAFKGHLRLRFRLIRAFPYLKSVDVMFMEPPFIDYKLKPVGGDRFGFDIAHFPGLPTLVRDIVNSVMGPMMYRPNVFSLDIESLMAAATAGDRAIGILKVTIRNGRGLKNAEIMGSSDPYCRISISGRGELARTKIVPSTLSPIWDETHFLILRSMTDTLRLEVYDDNKMKKDSPLGDVDFDLSVLENDPEFDEIIKPLVLKSGRQQGELNFGCTFYPVKDQQQLLDEGHDPTVATRGVLRVTIHQAKDLDPRKSLVGAYNPYALMRINGAEVHRTKLLKRTNNAIWEDTFETLVYDLDKTTLQLDIKDDRDLTTDVVIGSWEGKARAVIEQTTKQENWFQLSNIASGKARISCTWLAAVGLDMHREGDVKPPIGVIRLHMQEAKRLANVEGVGSGKSDPYVQVLLANVRRARTRVIEDDLDPIWDDVLYVPVHDERETLVLEVMDFNALSKDKCIGTCLLKVSELTSKPGETISPWAELTLGKQKGRGVLNYAAAFYPIVPTAAPADAGEGNVEGEEKAGEPATDGEEGEKKEKAPPAPINYSSYSSGVLGIRLIAARQLPRRGDPLAEIFLNQDSDLLVHRSKKKRKTDQPIWEEACDCFVKEPLMDMLTVQIRSKESEDEDSDTANVDIQIRDVLAQLGQPDFNALEGFWYGDETGPQVHIAFTYTPTEFTIDPSESSLNMGMLQVEVQNGQGLPAADKSGTSDPYVVFSLDGEKVHKTKVVKKKLDPVFDERFSTPINKLKSDLRVEVFDWNQVNQDKRLGTGVVELGQLEPGMNTPQAVSLSNGTAGTINVKLQFAPMFIPRMSHRVNTSFTQIVNPLNQMKNVGTFAGSAARGGVRTVSTIGGAAGGAVKSVFGFGKKHTPSKASVSTTTSSGGVASDDRVNVAPVSRASANMPADDATLMAPEMSPATSAGSLGVAAAAAAMQNNPSSSSFLSSGTQDASISRNPSNQRLGAISDAGSVHSADGSAAHLNITDGDASGVPGTLTVTVLGAQNLKAVDSGGTSDPYVKVHVGNKHLGKTKVIKKNLNPSWDERFTTSHITGEPIVVTFEVKDYNRIGASVAIGSYSFKLWDQLPANFTSDAVTSEVQQVPLHNVEQGVIVYRLDFVPADMGGSASHSGTVKSRFSFAGSKR